MNNLLNNTIKNELTNKAQNIKVFFIDVDGVMTDGSLYYGVDGEAIKKFNSLDGHGIKLLQLSGIEPVIITGRDSIPLRNRISELKIKKSFYGVEDKLIVADHCLKSLGLTWAQAAAIGDDWPDLPILLKANISFAPPQAHKEILTRVNYVCHTDSGGGAVREACDLLIEASGYYLTALNKLLT